VPVSEQQGDDLHLFCPTGFLDDSLWHRTYWGYGRAWASGAGGYHQAGRVIRRPAARVRRRDGLRLRAALAVLPLDDAARV
jgi:hypothetical protein